ncbi:MAG: mechanosensitive ion channel [Actinobacteria bacterium]|jgi:small-conductance mechanosensitive channel|nr:mechanosensitive ion channel [Actinomycetota bacterium]
MSFWEVNEKHFVNAGVSVLVLVAAWVVYWILRHSINRFSKRRELPSVDPGAETRLRMIQRLSAVTLFFVAVGLVFWIMDVAALKRVAVGMFASAGVVGIALGFAAQTTMANLVSGVIIAFAQPIRLGDRVTIDDEYGTVESIGLFYTNIHTWDNRRLVIPNKILSDQSIRNYTLVDPRMPALVLLRLEYGADVETVRTILLDEARTHPLFLRDPEPSVQVVDADNLGISVRLSAWAATQADAWTLAVDVREKAIRRLTDLGVSAGVRWSRIMAEPAGS